MPQQIICITHQTPLESDGVCHKCILKRAKQTAPQFAKFAKMITKKKKRPQ